MSGLIRFLTGKMLRPLFQAISDPFDTKIQIKNKSDQNDLPKSGIEVGGMTKKQHFLTKIGTKIIILVVQTSNRSNFAPRHSQELIFGEHACLLLYFRFSEKIDPHPPPPHPIHRKKISNIIFKKSKIKKFVFYSFFLKYRFRRDSGD